MFGRPSNLKAQPNSSWQIDSVEHALYRTACEATFISVNRMPALVGYHVFAWRTSPSTKWSQGGN